MVKTLLSEYDTDDFDKMVKKVSAIEDQKVAAELTVEMPDSIFQYLEDNIYEYSIYLVTRMQFRN